MQLTKCNKPILYTYKFLLIGWYINPSENSEKMQIYKVTHFDSSVTTLRFRGQLPFVRRLGTEVKFFFICFLQKVGISSVGRAFVSEARDARSIHPEVLYRAKVSS